MRTFTLSRAKRDDGFSMILVIGSIAVLMSLLVVVVGLAVQANTSSQQHQTFDQALDASEAGVDQALGRLTVDHSYAAGPDVPAAGFPACPAGMNGTAEQCWAKQQILALATSTPAMIQTGGTGQYLTIRPSNRQTVYSMGWSPSYGNARAKQRLLKTEYLFAPYRPVDAILTSGSMDMSGSVLVDSPNGTPAAVHSNGDVSSKSSDQIAGPVTASGSYDGNAKVTNDPDALTGSNTPLESIPLIDPRSVYIADAGDPAYSSNWYDMCPDGSVHGPDTTGFQPCAGPLLSASGPYRGWQFYTAGSNTCSAKSDMPNSQAVASCWIMTQNSSPYMGAYYVYQADAIIGDGGNSHSPWNGTVMAESAPTGGTNAACGKLGGNIDWKLNDMNNYLPGVVMLAQADLYDSANNNASDGLFAAGDQVHLHTSSATLTGAVLSADQCKGSPADSDQVQGVEIHFDDTGEAPISSIVNTTLWLEYTG
jgi:hypothetical protein